jgi:hypothetical protein
MGVCMEDLLEGKRIADTFCQPDEQRHDSSLEAFELVNDFYEVF